MKELQRLSLQHGMVVRDGTGHRVGTVRNLGQDSFEVRHGFSRSLYLLRYQDIESLSGGEIWVRTGRAGFRDGHLGYLHGDLPTRVKPFATQEQLAGQS